MFNTSRVNRLAKEMAQLAGISDLNEKVSAPAPFFETALEVGVNTELINVHEFILGSGDGSFRPARVAIIRVVQDERWKLFRRAALNALLIEHAREKGVV